MNIELKIEQNMPLVMYIIKKKFQPRGKEELDRYLQAGRIGLWKAIMKFDIVRFPNGCLSTYAYPAIYRGILQEKQFENKFRAMSLEDLGNYEF